MKTGLRYLVTAVLAMAGIFAEGLPPGLESLTSEIGTPALTKRAISPVQKYMSKLSTNLRDHYEDVTLMRNGEVVKVTIPCSELFRPNETSITKNGEKYLLPFLSMLKYPTMYKLVVAVHTDNTGDAQYQEEITDSRARSIIDFWAMNTGTEPSSAVPYGIGNENGLVENNSISNRAKNRRVEIYIVPNIDMVKTASAGKLK